MLAGMSLSRASRPIAVGLALCATASGCGAAAASSLPQRSAKTAVAAVTIPRSRNTTQIDRLTTAAQRLYTAEVSGSHAIHTLHAVGSNATLLRLLHSGNAAATRAFVQREYKYVWYHWHVSYLSLRRGSTPLINVGVPFVMPGPQMTLPGGATLRISMQDEIGFVRLMHRIHPNVQVLIRGGGQLRTSLHSAAAAQLPGSGTVKLAGHSYKVRSFRQLDWSGQRVTIWILI
jgi:hypothetical protein